MQLFRIVLCKVHCFMKFSVKVCLCDNCFMQLTCDTLLLSETIHLLVLRVRFRVMNPENFNFENVYLKFLISEMINFSCAVFGKIITFFVRCFQRGCHMQMRCVKCSLLSLTCSIEKCIFVKMNWKVFYHRIGS